MGRERQALSYGGYGVVYEMEDALLEAAMQIRGIWWVERVERQAVGYRT
jgi:hypothetical protein